MQKKENDTNGNFNLEIPEKLQGKMYLDPTYDPAFYALLDDEETLKDFLNSILHLNESNEIVSMDYTFNQPLTFRTPEAKEIKFDIHAWTKDRRCLDIEIQRASHQFFFDRVILYSAYLAIRGKIMMDRSPEFSAFSENEQKLRRYEIPEVISIWLCNFPLNLQGHRDSWHIYSDSDVLSGKKEPVSSKMNYIFVDLKKFAKNHSEASNREELWLQVLSQAGVATSPMVTNDPILRKALERIEVDSASKELLSKQVDNMVTQDEIDARIADSYFTGEKEGLEVGFAEGHEKGLAEGLEKGRIEAVHQIVLNLLKCGLAVEEIAKNCGISVDDVRRIQNDKNSLCNL
ncbi:MAG: Rpn family recombination-promoting nuclease/putative transposase [Fibrobacter sp.]|nr:Rpn family recombination-promoting nuclease/putative transposase [Fibrobacter sp.]